MCSAEDRYTLIEQSSNFRITWMQYSQKNFMKIIGNDQKNNGQNFWEILERIIGKISSIIGSGLIYVIYVAWAGVICLICTHEHEGAQRPSASSDISGKSRLHMLHMLCNTSGHYKNRPTCKAFLSPLYRRRYNVCICILTFL